MSILNTKIADANPNPAVSQLIVIGMADLNIAKNPHRLITYGLGSCVGVCLYDPKYKVAGMVHIMLPSSGADAASRIRAKFADTGVEDLITMMTSKGAVKANLSAKLAGGAHMFSKNTSDIIKVGQRNIEMCHLALRRFGIPVVAEDTGGTYGRTIELFASDGKLQVRTIGHGQKIL